MICFLKDNKNKINELKDNNKKVLERLKEKDKENERLKEELENYKKVSQMTHPLTRNSSLNIIVEFDVD